MIRKTSHIAVFILCILCTAVHGLSPSKEYKKLPDALGIPYKTLDIPIKTGGNLRGWLMEAKGSYKLVVISHEGTQNMSAFLERAKMFHSKGFSVLMYDYRGFGGSSSFDIDPEQYIYKEFYEDLGAVINYCQSQFGKDIILYGWGIGAAISLYHSYHTPNILGTIADDPFVSFDHLGKVFKAIHATMKVPDIGASYEPITIVQNEISPDFRALMYMHGANNLITNLDQIKLLYNHTNCEYKNLQTFSKSGRIDNFSMNKDLYSQLVYMFVLNL